MNLVWFHKLGSPKYFYALAWRLTPWLGGLSVILLATGLYWGLVIAPPDYQQGESYRIIFVHVPSAWMSMFTWMFMACCGLLVLVWRMKVAASLMRAAAPLGASFTFLALVTGSLWGKPMWGAYWVWDARLTSELILLFLYLGFMALQSAIEQRETAGRAGAVLALVGVINIPIIHYSVEWWNTLHQGATVTKFDSPSMPMEMLLPLLVSAAGFMAYFAAVVLKRARCDILETEAASGWVREWVTPTATEPRNP
ncbi:heme ABC transporter permease [Halofilum ochraceum]|uniref:heme ABC transporter permease n=1 Tax=Halofilum ochraceum TaxID=1611323 RepID=UPI0008D9932E|nr:heme ABC transporter permease [Halofilum ochraceum]